jgi:fluoroacetyl-CoA thioesterase
MTIPKPLARGLYYEQTIAVEERLTVPAVSSAFTGFADMPPVFATAFLVGFVEWTCIEALRPHLAPGQRTVGTHVDMSHCAATPVGLNVTASIELIEVEGRKLTFKVVCRDDVEVICEGLHERRIVEEARFLASVAKKQAISAAA